MGILHVMFPSTCNHPFDSLSVRKAATTTPIDRDFNKVTTHLSCSRCNTDLELKNSSFVGGVDTFLQVKDNTNTEGAEVETVPGLKMTLVKPGKLQEKVDRTLVGSCFNCTAEVRFKESAAIAAIPDFSKLYTSIDCPTEGCWFKIHVKVDHEETEGNQP